MSSRPQVWLVLLFVIFARAGRRARFEPLPVCSECVSPKAKLLPGIGFDLTDSYGTAAIRYPNGTTINLGKVDGNQDYIDMVERLSNPATRLSCHSTTGEEIHCTYLRLKSRLRKSLGLPATRTARILASILSPLITLVDSQLGVGTTQHAGVIPTMIALPGLERQDLQDALEHIGIDMLFTYRDSSYVWGTSAAFAGMEFGLCTHPENRDTCEDEEADMPYRFVLAVSLTNRSLRVMYTILRNAYRSKYEAESTRFDLGMGSVGEERYWERVREVIVDVGREAKGRLDALLLLGDCAGDAEALRAVREALEQLGVGEKMRASILRGGEGMDPLYVAARGSAELARRSLVSPPSCREPARCFANLSMEMMDRRQEDFGDEL